MQLLAFDLGASGGKMLLGRFDGSRLAVETVRRFENRQVFVRDESFWDILHIFEELQAGISQAQAAAPEVSSLGIDSFANDFGLLDVHGRLVTQSHSYRDPRTARAEREIYRMISAREMHRLGGNQRSLFGTLMQLGAMTLTDQRYLLDGSGTLLLLPDLLNYFLTGEKLAEYTIASVTQMLDFSTGDWHPEILAAFGLPRRIFPPVVPPGTRVGPVDGAIAKGLTVMTVCEHDTASAFLAAPRGEDSLLISSGTWSLVGVELASPIINDETFRHNLANEGGYPGHHRLLKNVMGLWIMQECRRCFEQEGRCYTYPELTALAVEEPPFRHMIDPNDRRFFEPGDMPFKIRGCCEEHGQKPPETVGAIIRCVMESLALEYRHTVAILEDVAGKRFPHISIVGGGSQNDLLNRFTAAACGRTVYAGPGEATAIGNMMAQLIAHGELASVSQGRALLMDSFPLQTYQPEDADAWSDRYRQYVRMFKQ